MTRRGMAAWSRGSTLRSRPPPRGKSPGGIDDAREVAQGARPIRKLFSKQQRAFFAEHVPEGIDLDELSVLGPITPLISDRRRVQGGS